MFDFADTDLHKNLPASLPILFMWGTKDAVCSRGRVERSKKFVPNMRVVEFQGVGHWVMVEASDAVSDGVIDFLNGLGRIAAHL